jgi:hypothetical protein
MITPWPHREYLPTNEHTGHMQSVIRGFIKNLFTTEAQRHRENLSFVKNKATTEHTENFMCITDLRNSITITDI